MRVVFDQRGGMAKIFFYKDGKWNIPSIVINISQANWIGKTKAI